MFQLFLSYYILKNVYVQNTEFTTYKSSLQKDTPWPIRYIEYMYQQNRIYTTGK